MMYALIIKDSAANDVIEAFLYYENILDGLGERFLQNWEEQLDSLKSQAELYQKKYKDFRQVSLQKFPYHVIYEIEGDTVVVYKVVYGGRHPRKRYSKH
ncbi:MAG: type II toxin-antitoxin system RelE/ParE family toxin [Bacteroidia bacterium]|nr:type II toxin-antitoxin system RelE/ParE family toxin [Bacteroidia bacterium]